MKIPKNPGPPSLPPDSGKSGGAGEAAGKKRSPASPKHGEAAEKLGRAGSNAAANLMKAGGSAKEFATVGMKILTQAATGAAPAASKDAAGAAGEAVARTAQAWTNVAGAIFGKAADLPKEVQEKVADAAQHVRGGAFDKAADTAADAVKSSPALDVNQIIQSVLRESYMEQTRDLQFYAEKVKHFNDVKGDVRDQIAAARKSMGGAITGNVDLGNQIKEWEDKLNSVGEDAQLANVDLQNTLQKQQQTLQTISNVSKMLHDTAMSVIRKIG